MYEGTSCETTDLDGQDSESLTIANDWGGGGYTVANDFADGYQDYVHLSYYITTKLVWV